MTRHFIDSLLVVLALTAASCLLSTMVTFMGGHRGGADMSALLLVQLASVPVSALLILFALIYVSRKTSLKSSLGALWTALPQWLLFIFFFLNSLVVIGEIALVIANRMTDSPPSLLAHVPLGSMLATSMAYLVLYGAQHFDEKDHRALSGRWSG